VTETEHRAFVLHIATFLVLALEEKLGMKTNLLFVYKRLLFGSFVTLVLSDIDNALKRRIRLKNASIFRELEFRVADVLSGWSLPPELQRNFAEFTVASDDSAFAHEEKIITYANMWASYYEAHFNGRVYEQTFDPILLDLRTSMSDEQYRVFRTILPIPLTESSPGETYLLVIRRLQSSYRWNKMVRKHPVSVMSHLLMTFFFSYVLSFLEHKNDDETLKMLMIALFHDIPEAITGDVITPTKNAIPGFSEILNEIETELVDEQLLHEIKHCRFSSQIRSYMTDPWGSDEGKILKNADYMSALFESKIESNESDEFRQIYRLIKKQLHSLGNDSVDFILKHSIDSFEDNLEEVIIIKKA
jgi:putative hydrolase of HD superfamily